MKDIEFLEKSWIILNKIANNPPFDNGSNVIAFYPETDKKYWLQDKDIKSLISDLEKACDILDKNNGIFLTSEQMTIFYGFDRCLRMHLVYNE